MNDDAQLRDDIALIRQAIEEGRSYATRCGPDMVAWGIALAAGFIATFAFARGYQSALPPKILWPIVTAVIWAYSLRWVWRRVLGVTGPRTPRSPIVMALPMLWLGLGVFLTILGLAALWFGDPGVGWLAAADAGAIGMAMFASAWLTGFLWLRWIAIAWWVGEVAVFALRHRPEMLLLLAFLMLLLLAGPGIVLAMGRRKFVAA